MILTVGLSSLVEETHGSMVNGECGTSESEFYISQTGVVSPIAGTNVALTDKSFTSTTVSCNYMLSTATATGESISEYEINDGSGTAYNRCLRAPFTKTDEIEFNIFHSFEFKIVV